MSEPTAIEDSRKDAERQEESDEHSTTQTMMPMLILPQAAEDESIPPEAIPSEQPPAFSSRNPSAAPPAYDTLPDYTRGPDPSAQRLPSYARATRLNSHTATIEELLPTEEERLASLRAFVEEKRYANDYYGGHKGSAEGPPNDPFKVFRWAKRKMSGEKGAVWRRMSAEQKREWEESGGVVKEAEGEVAWEDIDTSRIV